MMFLNMYIFVCGVADYGPHIWYFSDWLLLVLLTVTHKRTHTHTHTHTHLESKYCCVFFAVFTYSHSTHGCTRYSESSHV